MILILVIRSSLWGAGLLIALIPLDSVWSAFGGAWILKILGLAVLAVWLMQTALARRKIRLEGSVTFWLTCTLSLLALASGIWTNSLTPDYFLALLSYLSILVWLVFVVQVVASPAEMRWLLSVFVFSATLSACIAILDYLGTDHILSERSSGGALDPNLLAAILISALPITFGLFATSTGRGRVLWGLAVPLLSIGVLTSSSRAGFIGLVIAASCVMLLLRTPLQRITGALVIWVSICVGWVWAGNGVASRFAELSYLGGKRELERFDLWKLAFTAIQQHPLLGVGVGNFRYLVSALQLLIPSLSRTFYGNPVVHNGYLSIWVELGLAGLTIFLAILGLSLYSYAKVFLTKRKDNHGKGWDALYGGLALGFVLCLFSASTLNLERDKLLWFFVIMAEVVRRVSAASAVSLREH